MSIRAKFKCTSAQRSVTEGQASSQVRLEAVMDGSPENKQFFEYTPGGSVDLAILNPDAAEQFKEGREYFVDFSEAPAASPAADEAAPAS